MSTDPVEELDIGDSTTVTATVDASVWDVAPDDALGSDRRTEEVRITNACITGESGYERVEYDLEFAVKRVDARTKPVFQTAEHYAERSDTKPEPPLLDKLWPVAPFAVTATTVAAVSVIARRIMNAVFPKLTINGQAVNTPGTFEVVGLMFVVVAVVSMLPYLPRALGGGVGR